MDELSQKLIFTQITRFGSILFIIYAVAVLLNVFRYLMRLAAYYESRSHALMLTVKMTEADVKVFSECSEVLSAEKIEFGKEPSTPTENLIDLLKTSKDVVVTVAKKG